MKKVLALLFLFCSPGWSAIAYVQSKACGVNSSGPSACTFDAAVTAGSLLIVPCAGSSLGAALSVTDDNGDNFTLINGTTTTSNPLSGGGVIYGIWFATNATGGFTTVSCTDANSNTTWIVNPLHEYSGASLTTAFDIWSSSAAAGLISTTTAVSGSLTTTLDGELVFSFAPKLNAAATAGNGTIRVNSGVSSFYATEDAIVPLASTVYRSSFTFTSTSFVNDMAEASFKPPDLPAPGSHTWR